MCVGLQLYLHTKVQYELGLLHLRGGIIQSTPTTVDSLSEGVHTFVSTYTHVVLTSMFSHDSSVPGHGVSPQGLLKETKGLILGEQVEASRANAAFWEMFLIKSSPTSDHPLIQEA